MDDHDIPFYKRFIRLASRQMVGWLDRAKLTEHTFVIIVAVIIGLLGGYGAVVIQFAIKEFQELFWQNDFSLETLALIPWYWKIAVPTVGGIIVGLIIRYVAHEAKGHGVPEVMEAIALKNGVIRPRVVVAKLFASALYIASGGSVGREGPVVQIGSAVGSVLGQFLKVNPKRMRVFVACGAASGIAAAFNAPIAGALFSVEIILGDFAVPQFSPIVISSVMATVVSRHFLGDFPAFKVPAYTMESPFELINYVILGFLAGLVALSFIKSLYFTEDFFDKYQIPDWIKGAIGGISIGIMGIFFPQIFGVGYDSMDQALASGIVWKVALALVFLKMAATSMSLGSGGSGGIFAPSLFLGAMTGAFFGGVMHQLFPGWTADPGAYALVAMGGVVGAATHGPIAAILIIFELTNEYKIILPLMITTIIATLLASRLQGESIYTLKLARRGINIFGGREINVLRSLRVSELAKHSISLIPEQMRFTDILRQVVDTPHNYLYVHNPKGAINGFISIQEIRQTLLDFDSLKDLLIAGDIANPNVVIVHEKDTLDRVMKQFGMVEMDELPVSGERNGKQEIIGIIRQQDVIEAYNHQVFLRDMSGEAMQSFKSMKAKKSVHVVDKYHFSEIEAPSIFIGKTLAKLNLRNHFDLDLLLIQREELIDGEHHVEYIQPHGATKIKMNDMLLVFGKKEKIDHLRKV